MRMVVKRGLVLILVAVLLSTVVFRSRVKAVGPGTIAVVAGVAGALAFSAAWLAYARANGVDLSVYDMLSGQDLVDAITDLVQQYLNAERDGISVNTYFDSIGIPSIVKFAYDTAGSYLAGGIKAIISALGIATVFEPFTEWFCRQTGVSYSLDTEVPVLNSFTIYNDDGSIFTPIFEPSGTTFDTFSQFSLLKAGRYSNLTGTQSYFTVSFPNNAFTPQYKNCVISFPSTDSILTSVTPAEGREPVGATLVIEPNSNSVYYIYLQKVTYDSSTGIYHVSTGGSNSTYKALSYIYDSSVVRNEVKALQNSDDGTNRYPSTSVSSGMELQIPIEIPNVSTDYPAVSDTEEQQSNDIASAIIAGQIDNDFSVTTSDVVIVDESATPTAVPTAGPTAVPSAVPSPVPSITPIPEEYTPDITMFFPFCIPFDMYRLVGVFLGEPQAPVIRWEFTIPIIRQEAFVVEIDLSPYDGVASLLRKLETVAFVVGLAVATRKFISW